MKNTVTIFTARLNHHMFPAYLMLMLAFIFSGTILPQNSPARVNLRTADNFVILAKTGVSCTGATNITGHMGLSPAAATYITGFDLIMHASGTYSTSALVTGNIYAADYTSPTPSNMTTAIGDLETAYTDAAGRLLPDFTELYAGDLTGKTLLPGLYNWSTSVSVSAAGMTISGSASDIWIFQIAQNLVLANGAMITLSGGAQSSNIFWQVAGQVTLGTTASMKGIILSRTAIAMNTGASLNGKALAQTAVTIGANTVIKSDELTDLNDLNTPQKFELLQNYPNPFNPSTIIDYSISSDNNVEIKVYNLLGIEVATLVNELKKSGKYSIEFYSNNLPSGIYFYKIVSGSNSVVKKMTVLR